MADAEMKKELKDAPWYWNIAIDVVFLRSTPATAVVYGVAWVAAIVFVLLAFGVFTRIGEPGFERAGEAAKVKQQIQWLIGNDIEYFYAALCRLPDSIQREQVAEHFTRLQAEYKYVSGGQQVSLAPCPQGTPR